MASITLDQLEPEVVALILEFVSDTSPHTQTALVNKYFNSIYKLVSRRHLILRIDSFHVLRQLSSTCFVPWSEDHTRLSNVRSITIEGFYGRHAYDESQEYQDAWAPFAEFVTRIGRVRQLNWNIGLTIPLNVLKAVDDYHPRASLRMFNFLPAAKAEPTSITKALAKSPTLTHLRSVILRDAEHSATSELDFRYIVARAPNLVYAGILNKVGDLLTHHPEVDRYRQAFVHSKKPTPKLNAITLDGYEMSKRTLDDWSTTLDLSSLRNVKFSRGNLDVSYFQNAATVLPNLKHVSLNLRQLENVNASNRTALLSAVHHYLTTCQPLEHLSLWSWRGVIQLDDLLKRHGQTLKSLQLHEREDSRVDQPRQVMSCDEIELIMKSCGTLKHSLSVDLNRSKADVRLDEEDENLRVFKMLGSMTPRLNHFQIYFDLGLRYLRVYHSNGSDSEVATSPGEQDSDTDNSPVSKRARRDAVPVRPTDDATMELYIRDVWQLIFGSYRGGLRRLEVKVGEWESRWSSPANERDMIRHFVAKPKERNDEQNSCDISMHRIAY